MTVRIQEEHEAVGDWSVDIDWSPVIYDELTQVAGGKRLPRKVHILAYDPDDELIYTGVLLRVEGDERGLTIGGRGMFWWLGSGGIGPLVEDWEFIAGTQKLSSGDFSKGLLYWSTPQDTAWGLGGAPGAYVVAAYWPVPAPGTSPPHREDVLESEESFRALAGFGFEAKMTVSPLVGTLRRLWLRLVYSGRFVHPNVYPAPSAGGWFRWGAGGSSIEADGRLKIGPLPQPEANTNPLFAGGMTGWFSDTGGFTWDGVNAIYTEGAAPYLHIQNDHDPAPGLDGSPVAPREKYTFRVIVVGDTTVSPAPNPGPPNGTVEMAINWVFNDTSQNSWTSETLRGPVSDGVWNILELDNVSVPTDQNGEPAHSFIYHLIIRDQTTGRWTFIAPTSVRVGGNLEDNATPYFTVKPARAYKAIIPYRTTVQARGDVQVFLIVKGPNRPDQLIQGPTLPATDNGLLDVTPDADSHVPWDFTPPSGYTSCQIVIRATDVLDEWFISDWTLTEADQATYVDEIPAPTTPAVVTLTSIAPTGSKTVKVQVVAEEGTAGQRVHNVALHRMTDPAVTGDMILDGLLAGSSLTSGVINCPEVIPYDWHVLNMTYGDVFKHYCHVVSDPAREFRVNPDRTVDVDVANTPGAVFVDHNQSSATPILLLDEDIDVEDLPNVEADVEDRATNIKVLGTKSEDADGTEVVIAADADVPGTLEGDWNGAIVNRRRIVSDGTVDHLGYAEALVADLAAKEAEPALALTATLTGINTRPAFREGDWIYVYKPAAGIEDVANATIIEGRPVFPRRVRVFGRTRELGPAHRIEIRRTDGTTFDLDVLDGRRVQWSEKDATSLTIGDRRPEWQVDPAGPAAGNQYLRDRASAPR